jgi:hypothetical protein
LKFLWIDAVRLIWLFGVTIILLAEHGFTIHAQAFELSGGASTLYNAKGGSVIIHGQQMETTLGAGLVDGHFAVGAVSVRKTHAGIVTGGQQEFHLDLPTDVFDGSHLSFGTGLGLHTTLPGGGELRVFGGMSSKEGGTPLFRTTQLQRFAGFVRWTKPMTSRCTVEWMGFKSASSALFESTECRLGKGVRLAGTFGFGAGARYDAGSITIKRSRLELKASYVSSGQKFQRGIDASYPTPEPARENVTVQYKLKRHFELSGLHQNYTTQASTFAALGTVPTRSSLDMLGAQFWKRSTGGHISWLRSSTSQNRGMGSYNGASQALTAGFSQILPRIHINEDVLYATQSYGQHTILFITSVSVPVTSRLKLSEGVNISGSGMTFSHGGTWFTSRSSIDVDYRLLYLASRPDRPFQQVMSVDASLQLFRGVALHVGSSISPVGAPLYTFQFGKVLTHSASPRQSTGPVNVGLQVIRGRVEDPEGKPIEGAALLIGSQHVYTDADGIFLYREAKPRTHPFRVLADEFLTLETYVALSAPSEVTAVRSGSPLLKIVVTRGVSPQNSQPAMASTGTS